MKTTGKKPKPVWSQNIALRRGKFGWKAHELAERARIPYPTLRDIEAGYSEGRLEHRIAIATTLGCSIADLYIDPAKQTKDVSFAADFLAKLSDLPPEARQFVFAFVYRDSTLLDQMPDDLFQKPPNSAKVRKAKF
jgi:transcriptional regulator with XRE-family HTH domain